MNDRPSVYKNLASGTGSAQLHTGSTRVTGLAVDATGAVAVKLRDGTSASDPLIGGLTLAGAGNDSRVVPKVHCATGVFVERSAGAAVTVTLARN